MFDRSSYSKKIMKYVKLYVYMKVYLTINQNDMKRINNYLKFLNKTNDQTCTKKSMVSNILKRREYQLPFKSEMAC